MAFTIGPFSTLNSAGVDVTAVYTPSTATSTAFVPEYPGGSFVPGTRVVGNNNGEWVFVGLATATSVNKGNVCVFGVLNNPSLCVPLSNAAAATSFGFQVGVAMATAATGQQLWLQTKGANAFTSFASGAGATANCPCYTTVTAGNLTTVIATGTNYNVLGITPTAVTTAAAVSTTTSITSIELGLASLLPGSGVPF